MKCAFKECKSGLDGTVDVNEIIGDGSWRTLICTRCAEITGLKSGDDIPFDAAMVNRKLHAAYTEEKRMQEQSLAGKITDLGDLKPEQRFCKDCRHSRELGNILSEVYGCGVKVVLHPVDGKQRYAPCERMRSAKGVDGWPTCGPEGRLWEPRA
jgi:hypothetical protein